MLDYGCGMGIFMVQPACLGAKVVGVDISLESVKLARRLVLAAQSPPVNVTVGNCESLCFADDVFDVVFESGVLSCVRCECAFEEICRVLKPSGTVVFLDTLAYNPVALTARRIKLWFGRKDRWQVRHIVRRGDLALLHKYFSVVTVQYFDFFTLLAATLGYKCPWLTRLVVPWLITMDRLFLSLPGFRWLAFKFVCIASEPRRLRDHAGNSDCNRQKNL